MRATPLTLQRRINDEIVEALTLSPEESLEKGWPDIRR